MRLTWSRVAPAGSTVGEQVRLVVAVVLLELGDDVVHADQYRDEIAADEAVAVCRCVSI
jgi:hypothetical protein